MVLGTIIKFKSLAKFWRLQLCSLLFIPIGISISWKSNLQVMVKANASRFAVLPVTNDLAITERTIIRN